MRDKESLALAFRIITQQIKDSQGKVRETLIRKREDIVEKYKDLC